MALINALQLNLIGPAQPDEVLDQAPSRWYLTSILASLNPCKAEPGTGSAGWETDHDRKSVHWCIARSNIPCGGSPVGIRPTTGTGKVVGRNGVIIGCWLAQHGHPGETALRPPIAHADLIRGLVDKLLELTKRTQQQG